MPASSDSSTSRKGGSKDPRFGTFEVTVTLWRVPSHLPNPLSVGVFAEGLYPTIVISAVKKPSIPTFGSADT